MVNLARKDGGGGGEEWGPVGECEGEREKCVVFVWNGSWPAKEGDKGV